MDSVSFGASGSIPVGAVRASCIRYAFSGTISYPRNIIYFNREAVSVNTAEDLKHQGRALQNKHKEEKPKQQKTKFTVYQRREMETAFSQTPYISPLKRRLLSKQLGIPEQTIQIWFKNRRVKWRKDNRKTETQSPASVSSSGPAGLHFHYFGHVPYPSSKWMMKDARMLFGTPKCTALTSEED